MNNHIVSKGFSKIIKVFCENYNPKAIIGYADRSYSQGKIYEKNGFTKIGTSDADYYYLRANEIRRYPRSLFQKHTLKNKLEIYDPSISELKNMKANSWNRIWDSGQLVYSLNLKTV